MTTNPPTQPPVTGPPEPKEPTPPEQLPVETPEDEDSSEDRAESDDDPEPSGPPAEPRPPPTGYRSKAFWVRTAERAIKSAAQVAVLLVVADTATGGVNVTDLDWPALLAMAAGGALLSVLTSIISQPFGTDPNTPSTVD